jgi:DNA-binding XRE family transcriptional regulator
MQRCICEAAFPEALMQRNAPDQEEMKFSLILRDLRRRLGLTQAEMALKLKISCTTLSGWETDKHGRCGPMPPAS